MPILWDGVLKPATTHFLNSPIGRCFSSALCIAFSHLFYIVCLVCHSILCPSYSKYLPLGHSASNHPISDKSHLARLRFDRKNPKNTLMCSINVHKILDDDYRPSKRIRETYFSHSHITFCFQRAASHLAS